LTLKEKVLELLKDPDVINKCGLNFYDIRPRFDCTEYQLKTIINELKKENLIVAVPFKRARRWHLSYYSPPQNAIPVRERIEEVFTELAIPPFVRTRVFRGAEVMFVGEWGKKPGFTIIDYSEDPPLIFHSRLAGGKKNEIVNYKSRSKYRCNKDGKVIWYSYIGQKKEVFEEK
jgi:hypothetical protein